MPQIILTEFFRKRYAKLPPEIQKKVRKAIKHLAEDPRHPSLRTKPVEGTKGIYEARVDRNYRMTYERLVGDTLLLRVVGKHDKTLKNP
jgi:mRNA-degrading endonuclease RelE of RelBE toxin-antitoxin system